MTDFCFGCVFRECIFAEGLAKQPPKIGLLGGQNLHSPPTILLPYVRPSQPPYKAKSENYKELLQTQNTYIDIPSAKVSTIGNTHVFVSVPYFRFFELFLKVIGFSGSWVKAHLGIVVCFP